TFMQSTSFTDNDEIINYRYETKFDHVFLYKFWGDREYYELS
ncbi:unnamed protein product, partial [marine sediment metagenome]